VRQSAQHVRQPDRQPDSRDKDRQGQTRTERGPTETRRDSGELVRTILARTMIATTSTTLADTTNTPSPPAATGRGYTGAPPPISYYGCLWFGTYARLWLSTRGKGGTLFAGRDVRQKLITYFLLRVLGGQVSDLGGRVLGLERNLLVSVHLLQVSAYRFQR
jgi:hypothetical protein